MAPAERQLARQRFDSRDSQSLGDDDRPQSLERLSNFAIDHAVIIPDNLPYFMSGVLEPPPDRRAAVRSSRGESFLQLVPRRRQEKDRNGAVILPLDFSRALDVDIQK